MIFRAVLLSGLLLFSLTGCKNADEKEVEIPELGWRDMAPEMPSNTLNVGFLVLDSVYNSELMGPWDIFHHTVFHADPGMRVFMVAKDTGMVTTFEGLRLKPDYSIQNAPRIDVLAVPSALHNMDTDLEDEAVLQFIRERGEQAKYVISFCDGAFMLAQAGLLDGLHATTFPGDIDPFEEKFRDARKLQVHRDVSFVHDGKAITSAGGAISYDAAMYLVERLYGRKAAEGVGRGMVIDWDPGKISHYVAE